MFKILLATDGQPGADGAVRMAITLSRELEAQVEVVRAVEPMPVIGDGSALSSITLDRANEQGRSAEALARLEERMKSFGALAASWPRSVEPGPAPYAIVRAAQEQEVSLILMGAGRHNVMERWFGSETATRVVRVSHIPVLAVPERGGDRPRSLVAAVDFSGYSKKALEETLPLCAPGSRIHLAHVIWPTPMDEPDFVATEWYAKIEDRLSAELADWAETIEGLGDFDVELHLLHGEIADEVVQLADRVGAELVVAGSHGLGFMGRVLLGSVSKRLLRAAHSAVLIVPPTEPVIELAPTENRVVESIFG
ncbi:MAG TPA: universal stress protein [Longimicrobiaceae bacterium]|nr:universal stress protein [Longimicrobiaceae bacterium]